jgi:hypothetical protein
VATLKSVPKRTFTERKREVSKCITRQDDRCGISARRFHLSAIGGGVQEQPGLVGGDHVTRNARPISSIWWAIRSGIRRSTFKCAARSKLLLDPAEYQVTTNRQLLPPANRATIGSPAPGDKPGGHRDDTTLAGMMSCTQ